jgi:hypothetical protein
MSQTKTPSLTKPITIASDDPEVMALQAMIRGLEHFDSRNLSMLHLKILMAVELCLKLTSGKLHATADQIATFTRLQPEDFASELDVLVDKRYLHEDIEPFGGETTKPHYKIGSMGGTVLRNMMNRPPKRIRKK